MKPRHRRSPIWILLLGLLAACGGSAQDPGVTAGLPRGTLTIGADRKLVLNVDLALTVEAQARGLMGVKELPRDYGMVFAWAEPGIHTFYMKNTLIPLDIAWWNEEMEIVDIQTMQPCTADPCRTYVPAAQHTGAVEVAAGLLESSGVKVGDRVRLE